MKRLAAERLATHGKTLDDLDLEVCDIANWARDKVGPVPGARLTLEFSIRGVPVSRCSRPL